ncbi:DMT family transporter [Pseudidiomarina woesei]|uniref:EamA-like transporter family n=1 Tax=Pseudidiomarina woesei TaxID=1381080 RepID=A0A0K6H228_9GAMM|nr:DMT family transporter [Pseudidiomarina woesei]CUA85037.1 EamA-like transporter family [Pseudidiomarina woesei]
MFRTAMLFFLSLLAFAGNSVINRYALLTQHIDPNTFVAVRIVSGAVAMLVIWYTVKVVATSRQAKRQQPAVTEAISNVARRGTWWGAFTLALYAVAFSLAYNQLETGFGALILFASVQLSMLAVGWVQGNKLTAKEALGSSLALLGLIYLVYPTLGVPSSLWACVAMVTAGTAWGLYSLHGRGSASPLTDTTFNFVRATPVVVLLVIWQYGDIVISPQGLVLAVCSGVVTSGLGYAIWYLVLPQLKVSTAAIGQLSVPLIAAVGGVVFAREIITQQLVVAALLIVGGMLIVIRKPTKPLK